MNTPLSRVFCVAYLIALAVPSMAVEAISPAAAQAAMRKAAAYFRTNAASHGGYVYYYSPDFSQRWGEGKATKEQVWVQPPGTPAVGLAYLKAFAATGDTFYLDAAREAAEALVYGQLASGGWTNCVDFDPAGSQVAQYRNGKGRGRNYSTLDDGISQGAIRLLAHADRALGFKHREIHDASEIARTALLAAQFSNGAFPQVWSGAVNSVAAGKAQFPDYDWRTENRIKNYWDMPTLNDDLAITVSRTLADAWEIYKDERCRAALVKLGDFLLLAQMPEPQPGWAQQYDLQMRPIWARKFEPPALAGRESMGAIETLIRIHQLTGDAKYLEPIPRALAWLKRSLLPDGRVARYYELQTNKPLYMTSDYKLTNSDADVPQHYGWKADSRIAPLEAAFAAAKQRAAAPLLAELKTDSVAEIVRHGEGRWMSTYTAGAMLVGQPKFKPDQQFLASEVFSRNLETLSDYLEQARRGSGSK